MTEPHVPEGQDLGQDLADIETTVRTRSVAELAEGITNDDTLPPGVFHTTDSGNALRLTHLYGDVIRYAADSRRWYAWDGSRWKPDVDGLEVLELTQGVPRYMREVEATLLEDDDATTRLIAFAHKSESERARVGMMRLAPANDKIKLLEADLDADPWLLVVENGTLDLRTGKLRESRPEDLCTRRAAVTFDPDADCPLWKEHIKLVTRADPVLAAYLRRACGYSLTGLVDEQKFWFLWGSGQNGKNVFVETLLGLLGEYGAVGATGLLTGGTNQHPTILADLRGARLVMSDETGHERVNEGRLKMLTGSGRIKARFSGKDFFDYESTMKLWILGNTKPTVKDQTDGTWRRMQLVPFTVRIPDDRKRLGFVDELRAEWPGILNWCLTGLRDWQTLEGMGTPDIVAHAVDQYRREEDDLGQWLEECCEPCSAEEWTATSELYLSYTSWAGNAGLKSNEVLKKVAWGRALTGRHFGEDVIGETSVVRTDDRTVRVRHGIKLQKTPWPATGS